jgi:hypothetical protein
LTPLAWEQQFRGMAKLTKLQVAAAIAGIVGASVGALMSASPGGIAAGRDVNIGHIGDVITQILPAQPQTKPKHPLDEKLPGFATGLVVQTNDVTEERSISFISKRLKVQKQNSIFRRATVMRS